MARKSRKNHELPFVGVQELETPRFKTAVYVRLSLENSGKDDDGDSIENQKQICLDYLSAQSDLELYDVYEDNGFKGTNMNRPAFQRMMEDIRNGKVDCVLVKDLSRFSRDYIDAGDYLEKYFPFMGVRFIAVTDRYDSFFHSGEGDDLLLPLKNMINTAYAKDISQKILASFRDRQSRAEILPGIIPYGYVKSKTRQYRLEVDEKAAPYVKMIFQWKLEGLSRGEMCRRLNEMGAIAPGARKYELGIYRAEKYKYSTWKLRTVFDILHNPIYTGCLVYGRMPKDLSKGLKGKRTDSSQWTVFPYMHEPIISQEDFDRVQQILKETATKYSKTKAGSKKQRDKIEDHFQGKVFCGDCGREMRFRRQKNNDGSKYYSIYLCGTYLGSFGEKCSRHTMSADTLENTVLAAVKSRVERVEEMESQIRDAVRKGNKLIEYQTECRKLSRESERLNAEKKRILEGFLDGKYDQEEYYERRDRNDDAGSLLTKKWKEMKTRMDTVNGVIRGTNRWLEAVRIAKEKKKVDPELVEALISRVNVYEDNRIEVEFDHFEQRKAVEQVLEWLKEEGEEADDE